MLVISVFKGEKINEKYFAIIEVEEEEPEDPCMKNVIKSMRDEGIKVK